MRKRPEEDLQRAVVKYLRFACPEAITFAIPNGGYRTRVEAAIFQGLGVLPGVSDLCILWPIKGIGFTELKAPGEKKTVTPNQVAFLIRLTELGIWNAVCDSLDEVRGKVKEWGVPCREVR